MENIHTLDPEIVDSLINMFNSEDEDNVRIGLTILNNADFTDDKVIVHSRSTVATSMSDMAKMLLLKPLGARVLLILKVKPSASKAIRSSSSPVVPAIFDLE